MRKRNTLVIGFLFILLATPFYTASPIAAYGPRNGETWIILTTYGRVNSVNKPVVATTGLQVNSQTIPWAYVDMVFGNPSWTGGAKPSRYVQRVSLYVTLYTDYAPVAIAHGRMTAFYRVYAANAWGDTPPYYSEVWIPNWRLRR